MKIAQETEKELKNLSTSQMMIVHDLIVSLKNKTPGRLSPAASRKAYRRSQRAYSGYKGNLSDDICAMREDRV
jgi:hypothetical protein